MKLEEIALSMVYPERAAAKWLGNHPEASRDQFMEWLEQVCIMKPDFYRYARVQWKNFEAHRLANGLF